MMLKKSFSFTTSLMLFWISLFYLKLSDTHVEAFLCHNMVDRPKIECRDPDSPDKENILDAMATDPPPEPEEPEDTDTNKKRQFKIGTRHFKRSSNPKKCHFLNVTDAELAAAEKYEFPYWNKSNYTVGPPIGPKKMCAWYKAEDPKNEICHNSLYEHFTLVYTEKTRNFWSHGQIWIIPNKRHPTDDCGDPDRIRSSPRPYSLSHITFQYDQVLINSHGLIEGVTYTNNENQRGCLPELFGIAEKGDQISNECSRDQNTKYNLGHIIQGNLHKHLTVNIQFAAQNSNYPNMSECIYYIDEDIANRFPRTRGHEGTECITVHILKVYFTNYDVDGVNGYDHVKNDWTTRLVIKKGVLEKLIKNEITSLDIWNPPVLHIESTDLRFEELNMNIINIEAHLLTPETVLLLLKLTYCKKRGIVDCFTNVHLTKGTVVCNKGFVEDWKNLRNELKMVQLSSKTWPNIVICHELSDLCYRSKSLVEMEKISC